MMMTPFSRIEKLLLQYCSSPSPLLLALSGGADSLYLFYALLFFRKQHAVIFHVAHVDHRWRKESQDEARALQQLALQYQIPFHLKVLNPSLLKGNLEAACREERYTFFKELFKQFSFQALLTGHHYDDQAETVFKRLLEGSHWSRWAALQHESWINGMRVVRPLLDLGKKEIQQTLFEQNISAFEDPSNKHVKFLRARLRETIFPRLNQEFGKRVEKNLAILADEAQELKDYFDLRLIPLLNESIDTPIGIYLDLQEKIPASLLEIKYLLRLLCSKKQFFLSREMIAQMALALQLGKANQRFAMGKHWIWIDRQRIFIPASSLTGQKNEILSLIPTKGVIGDWVYTMTQETYTQSFLVTSWKEGWKGELRCYLPFGEYKIGFKDGFEDKRVKKRWAQAKVPAFLYYFFPLIWEKGEICHEFLTSKLTVPLLEGTPCWKIELKRLE